MATVLQEYTNEEQRYVLPLYEQKDSMQRIFIEKYYLFTVGSFCRVNRLTILSRNSLKDFWNSEIMLEQVRKIVEKTVKKLLTAYVV
jgi:hypothetical protein